MHFHMQVCHVAAQYGQTAFLYYMALRWDADIDEPDVDGRAPLHWAAYKGFADTLRLLLVMDAQWGRADREVSTADVSMTAGTTSDECVRRALPSAGSIARAGILSMYHRRSLADRDCAVTAGLHAAALGSDQGQCGGVHAVAAGDHVAVLSAVEICGTLCQVLQPPGI